MAARTYLDHDGHERHWDHDAATRAFRAAGPPPRRWPARAAYLAGSGWFAATLLLLAITRGGILW